MAYKEWLAAEVAKKAKTRISDARKADPQAAALFDKHVLPKIEETIELLTAWGAQAEDLPGEIGKVCKVKGLAGRFFTLAIFIPRDPVPHLRISVALMAFPDGRRLFEDSRELNRHVGSDVETETAVDGLMQEGVKALLANLPDANPH